ncbi:MAG: tyrosine-type recombinase/integrase [Solirubrobacteraceae bacterium]
MVRLGRLDGGPHRTAAWTAVLRDRRANPRPRVVGHRRARRAAPLRRPGWGAAPVAPHQLRHAHAIELLHEGIPLPLIQRQLGHAYLSTTRTYLEGISSEEIVGAAHGRKAPMMHANTGLEL